LEIADIFVISKADKPEADQTVAELAMLLSLDPTRGTLNNRVSKINTDYETSLYLAMASFIIQI
jgi:LAO/AO transport system kinase